MKRALLIAGGTVGGLGAVLAITPPQFTSSQTINLAGGGIGNPSGNSATTAAPASTPSSQTSTPTQSASATPTTKQSAAATKAAAKAATKKATSTTKAAVKSTKNNSSAAVTTSAAQDTTQSQTPTPAAPPTQTATPTPTTKSVSGTFTGPVVNVSYGNVQVQITVSNGKITDAQALVAPSGRNDRFTSYAVPILRKQTLSAQSDAIQGASGASYTSYGWYKSLQGALSKAGL
ncbi:MAG: hypothetical protein NTZ06_00740 [Actinobacteria bacterium]|nr:hypothetical protein [Actinomycetota bacterium]